MKKTKVCKHGTFSFYDNDKWIGGSLDVRGEYSPEEVDLLLQLVPEGGVVVEVGANIGSITVPLASRGVVIAFEPSPANYELLSENAEQNDTKHVVIPVQLALGRSVGEVGITSSRTGDVLFNSGETKVVPIRRDGEGQSRVQQTTLDEFFSSRSRLDLLKVDVEGSELDVIVGGRETINRLRPVVYIENDRPEQSAKLIGELSSLGYAMFWHFPKIFDPAPVSPRDVVSVNMLCLPREREFPSSIVRGLRPVMSDHDDWKLALQRMEEAESAVRPKAPPVRSNTWACVVRLGGVGDNLIASSVFPALKKKYGHLEVICAEPQNVVLENNPYVDKLTVRAHGDPPWQDGDKWQRHWLDRSKEYAFFANLSHSCETHRALTRIQTSYYWGASVRRKICGQNYMEAVADICDVGYEDLDPRFFPTDREVESAIDTKRLVGGRYVGWVMSGTRVDKVWPPAAVVIARIIKELKIPVIVFGAPGRDFELAKQVQAHVIQANGSEKDFHLACSVDPSRPNWPVRRILSQVQQADVVVTPDTGPAWAVAMESMPKVVLLSHASPENITKYWKNTLTLHADAQRVPCWPCHLLIDEPVDCERLSGVVGGAGAACISSIQPDVVVEAVRKSTHALNPPLLDAAE